MRDVPADARNPFPTEAVRDLLGINRALYRAEFAALGASDHDDSRLQRIAEVGNQLREALELSKAGPGTMGMRAAWMWAERGAQGLGEVVGEGTPMAPAVHATVAKLRSAG